MKSIFTSIVLSLIILPALFGQNTIEVSASAEWKGFMNVFNLGGGYEFGSEWGIADLKTVLDTDANTVTLQPNFNTYADNPGDAYWIDPATGEGAKVMEASTFIEPGASFNGEDLTFSGAVVSNTMDESYEVRYFIKALDPNNNFSDALGGAGIMDMPESGMFTVTISGDQLAAGLLIQCGFSVTGRNANPANEAALGSVVISDMAVSVDGLVEQENNIRVFPNPATDLLLIESNSTVQAYEVATITGQTVLMGQANNNNIDVSSLVAGTYLIRVQVAEGQQTLKFIKR
jgi:hypothetical protein